MPGTANFYATTYVQDGDAVSILAKVRDGRPIKIEGNELSPVTAGGTSARVQASVLDLYDTARLRYPFISRKQNEVTLLRQLTGQYWQTLQALAVLRLCCLPALLLHLLVKKLLPGF